MKSKDKVCKNCGTEITGGNIKKCPSCGAKIAAPVYKKWWFWVIIVLGVAIIGSGGSEDSSDDGSNGKNDTTGIVDNSGSNSGKGDSVSSTPKNEDSAKYEVVDLQQMLDELDQNALKAQNTYKGKYIEVSGKIANFDSSGAYISIEPKNADEWNFDTVMCYIKNDAQRDFLMEKSVGDVVTIRGKVTSVGELLGYSMNIDSIN